jgi:YVTN family beta-propeller protein
MENCMSSTGCRAKSFVLAGAMVCLLSFVSTLSAQPFAYVASSSTHTVTVLDTFDNSIVDTISVGMYPFEVAVSPDGSHVYVRNSNFTDPDSISVIQTSTNTVIKTISIPTGAVSGLGMSPDGARLYISLSDLDSVLEVDTATNTLVGGSIAVGDEPSDLVVAPDGKYVYVANNNSNSISVIQVSTRSVVATVTGAGLFGPAYLRVTPDGSKLVVLGYFGWVALVDTTTRSVVDSMYLGPAFLRALAISPDGNTCYLGHSPYDQNTFDVLSDDIKILNIPTFTVAGTIPISSTGVPAGYSVFFTSIAFTPNGDKAYVSMQNKNRLGVINTATRTVVTEIPDLYPSVSGQFIVPANSFLNLIFSDGFESGNTSKW